jgi:hypothetical protein
MEEEIFVASSKDRIVKALGIRVAANLEDLHVYVNGVDIVKSVVLEEVRITTNRKEQKPSVVTT